MNHISTPPIDLNTWSSTRHAILEAAQEVMGPFPAHDRSNPPSWSIIEETDCGTYLRQRITYEADAGCHTTAFICRPPTASATNPAPGVLCLHPTNSTHGYEDVVGLSGRPNRNYASELAEHGFVTISPSYPKMADYQPDIDALGYVSGTMKAIWDNVRALDLMDSFDDVRSSNYGAIGHSLGGHNSVYTAVFDERIKATVSNCGLDSYVDYYKWEPGKGWTQHRYMPRIGNYPTPADIPFDFHDLIASLAPRACMVSAPLHDDNFVWQSAASVVKAASVVYSLYAAVDRLRIIHPDCPHDFPPAVREECYDFLSKQLTT
jgi:pimeloyl-ACP methyl ester carboxylesterase